MAEDPPSVNRSLCAWILVALALSGCARGKIIQATKMPNEYVVAPMSNAQTIDLSKLAVTSVSSELIDRGDVLEISLESGYEGEHKEKDNALTVRVGEDGVAQIPLVGPVLVAGLEPPAAEQTIRELAVERGVFRNPHVAVLMKQQRMNKVTVIGAVNKPGTYELPRGSSALLSALVMAGGLSVEAGTDIEVRRPALRSESVPSEQGGEKVAGGNTHLTSYQKQPALLRPASNMRIDLVAATKETTGNPNYYLDDGDVVMVEKRDPIPVSVIGLVNKPGQIKLPPNQDVYVLDAISQAGGLTTPYINKAHVIRHVSGNANPVVIGISLKEAKTSGQGNLRLGPGDVVSVEQTPLNFTMDMFKILAPYSIAPTLNATLPFR